MVKIIADIHEEKSGNFERIQKEAELQIESLEVGDYILSDFFVVERKEYNDLYGSILGDWDHNVKLQLQRCHHNFKVVVIAVIKSKQLFNATDLKYEKIEKFLKHEELFEGTFIRRFPTEDKFVEWLIKTATTLQMEKHTIEIPRIKPKVKTLQDLREFWYQGLIDTGIEKAETLNNLFQNPKEFMTWINTLEFVYTSGGNYKGIKTIGEPNEIKGFGEKWYNDNKQLLFGDD